MLKSLRALAILACVAGLSACGGGTHSTPVVGADGQPTGQVVQQQDSPGLLGMFGASLAGNMVGNMLSGGGSRNAAPSYSAPSSTTVVNRTVVNKTIINHPPAPVATPAVKPPVVSTAPKWSPPKPTVRSNWGAPSRSSSFSSRGGRR